jgi:uncharacterized protein DUF5666
VQDFSIALEDFTMKGMAFRFMIVSLLLALMAIVVQFAIADNEAENVKIQVEAPLDAFDCLGTPPTITVLGLTIDISRATIEGSEDSALTCADFVVGQVVEVTLASDIPNQTTGFLTALKVDAEGEECDDDDCVEIEAPIQAVDQNGQTITLLGLVIDISQAEIDGDDSEEDGNQAIDPSQLIVGQFVEVKLASNQAPLAATEIEIKNFGNEVEIELVDANGNEIEDDDDDVAIDATVTALVGPTAPSPGVKAAAKGGKKVLKFHARSNGSMILNGLPTGSAKIVVTRIHNGRKSTAKSSAKILGQSTTRLSVRLK